MSTALLTELYARLPELLPGDDEQLWAAGAQDGMRAFRAAVRERYTEGTLQRLLHSADVRTRRAAVLALGLVGTIESNPATAAMLRDDDPLVRRFASDALWEVWFRGGTADQNWALQQAVRNRDAAAARHTLDELIRQAPHYAEAYNQRAIWYFKRGEYTRAVEDCEAVLRLNPFHFGAAAGMGQCLLKLNRPRAALRAFRQALEINPNLDLHDAVRALEDLGEE
ncbi:MAG: tetratricopeptide repeat protein [Gemmataceae bacterium]|nr:tetratricopeptide repeat protein [Gemmataceae bacterium]